MSDVKIFVPENNKVVTVSGDKVKIPKLSWKKELQLLKIIEGSVAIIVEQSNRTVTEEVTDPITNVVSEVKVPVESTPADLIQYALQNIPEKVTEFMSIVMGKDTEWVENELDSTEILGVIVPLLKSRLDLIGEKIAPYLQNQTTAAAIESAKNLVSGTETRQ